MPYTVDLFPIDLGGFIGTGPALSGVFMNILPTIAIDAATASTAAPLRLSFPVAMAPPPGVASLSVRNPGGDLFRSGLLNACPPMPAALTVLSVPTTSTTLLESTLTAVTAGLVPIPLTPARWLVWLMSIMTGFMFIPVTGTILTLVPTVGTPAGGVTFAATGFFIIRVGLFTTQTVTFTGTLSASPAPSGDTLQQNRILAVPCTTSLSVSPGGPSPTLALTSLLLTLLGPAAGSIAGPALETAINDAIIRLAGTGLASMGFRRTSSSVISARRVVVTPPGPAAAIRLSLVLADLPGPAITPLPRNLNARVAPPPVSGSQRVYTVTVTDASTAAPIDQADVRLHNFATDGTAQTVGPLQTNASGEVMFDVALRPKISVQIIREERERVRVFFPPTLTVAKAGFNTLTLRLLEDDL